jgi:hypothetical protein
MESGTTGTMVILARPGAYQQQKTYKSCYKIKKVYQGIGRKISIQIDLYGSSRPVRDLTAT